MTAAESFQPEVKCGTPGTMGCANGVCMEDVRNGRANNHIEADRGQPKTVRLCCEVEEKPRCTSELVM